MQSSDDPSSVGDCCFSLLDEMRQSGIDMRVYGGVGVWLHCLGSRPWLQNKGRRFKDIDLVCEASSVRRLVVLLRDKGYREDSYTSRFSAPWRRIFRSETTTIDLAIDRLVYCHQLDLRNRLQLDWPTLSLADLFLSKVQNVTMTDSDRLDLVSLVTEHALAEGPASEAIDLRRIASVLCNDWGFFHTVTQNLNILVQDERARERTGAVEGLTGLQRFIADAPKTLWWSLRRIVGTRLRWYTPVE